MNDREASLSDIRKVGSLRVSDLGNEKDKMRGVWNYDPEAE
jgi:hypothetical protein